MDTDVPADIPADSGTLSADRGAGPSSAAADRRILTVLCLASFLAVVNFAAPAPFFPDIARDLGTSVPLLGQVATALTLLSALLGLVAGPVADRYGHRRLMIGGVVAVALNLLGTGLAPSYLALLMLAVLGGLGDAVLFGLPLAIAGTHFVGESRRRAMSWTSAALSLGTIAGVPVLTAIGGALGWRAAIGSAGLVTLGVAWLTGVWLPTTATRRQDRFRTRALLAAYRPLLRHPPLLVLYAANGLRMACWIGLVTYLGAFLREALDLDDGWVGFAYMGGGVGAFLGSLAMGARLGRLSPRPLVAGMTAAQAVLLATIFTLPLGTLATLALLPLAAFCGSAGYVGIASLLALETPGGAATTMVLNGSVLNLGAAGGIALGGLLIAVGGYSALGIGLPAFALVGGLLVLVPTASRGARSW